MTLQPDEVGAAPAPAAGGPPPLAVSNVEVVYDEVILVLRGLSLKVPQGSVVALLGANGAAGDCVRRAGGYGSASPSPSDAPRSASSSSDRLIPSRGSAIHTTPSQVECDIGAIRMATTVASLAELTERRNSDAQDQFVRRRRRLHFC
jgi:hypothetical protein